MWRNSPNRERPYPPIVVYNINLFLGFLRANRPTRRGVFFRIVSAAGGIRLPLLWIGPGRNREDR